MGTDSVVGPEGHYSPKRRWPRYKLDIPVRVIVVREANVKVIPGRGNELNEGGLTIFAGVELAMGEEIAVEYTPAYSGMPIRARGIVRNRKGYKYGIELVVDSSQDTENVARIRAVLQGYGVPIF